MSYYLTDKRVKKMLGLLIYIENNCVFNGCVNLTNKELGELFSKHPKSISRNISELQELGYITTNYVDDKNGRHREIRMA